MYVNDSFMVCVAAAFVLDLIAGDPEYSLHPVRIIGKIIEITEPLFRRITGNQVINGTIFAVCIISGFTILVIMIQNLCNSVDQLTDMHVLSYVFSIYIIYSCISVKDLRDKTIVIYSLLKEKKITGARTNLSMIVGRETDKLGEKEIIRATVETISENIVDGIFSPLFFLFIFGVPGIIAYKTINTLDSMVGYKNERYINFGNASARIDDAANYIPARLSFLIIPVSSLFANGNFVDSIKIGIRDGRKNPSPNSGISEALVAGALALRFGGVNYYHGRKVIKPYIGEKKREFSIVNIKEAIRIEYASSILFLLTGLVLYKIMVVTV